MSPVTWQGTPTPSPDAHPGSSQITHPLPGGACGRAPARHTGAGLNHPLAGKTFKGNFSYNCNRELLKMRPCLTGNLLENRLLIGLVGRLPSGSLLGRAGGSPPLTGLVEGHRGACSCLCPPVTDQNTAGHSGRAKISRSPACQRQSRVTVSGPQDTHTRLKLGERFTSLATRSQPILPWKRPDPTSVQLAPTERGTGPSSPVLPSHVCWGWSPRSPPRRCLTLPCRAGRSHITGQCQEDREKSCGMRRAG